jgi:outer membrane protein assembly factor BamB
MRKRIVGIMGVLIWTFLGVCLPVAADWPAYRHDNQRSGLTTEQLKLPLGQQWAFHPPYAPHPAWPEPARENAFGGGKGRLFVPLMTFDRAHQPVASGGMVYFGSSADHKVYCLDGATGKIKWAFHTEGPVRMAPTIAAGKLYVGSDDGWVYCLDASRGELQWKVRPGPRESRLPANEQISSRWPVRSGVLVDGKVAYFAAGVFPEREGTYLAAVDAGSGTQIWKQRIKQPAQGYMVASAGQLYVPSGEGPVTVYSRRDGASLGSLGPRGNFCVLAGDVFVTGPGWWGEQLALVRPNKAAGVRLKLFRGNQLVADPNRFYVLTTNLLYSADRNANNAKWRKPSKYPYALIMAGDLLFAGGNGEVAAFHSTDGKLLWTGKVDGRAYALAVADGRLLVGTDKGGIHCFAGGPGTGKVVRMTGVNPFPEDKLSKVYTAAAKKIVEGTPVRKGYALVLGCGEGRLAYEIARRTNMTVIGVEEDPKKVAAGRQALDKAARYGGRVSIHQGPLDKLPYVKYAFNLIVSDRTLATGALPPSAAEMYRVLKPCGGVAYVGRVGPQEAGGLTKAKLESWLKAGKIDGAKITESDEGLWAVVRRGGLPGAGQWSHQYANVGNTVCSEDTAVKKPLQMLWYGRPGPRRMFDRHSFATGPLCVNGRLFVLGEKVLLAQDAYNGTALWTAELPELPLRVNIPRDCGFAAATDQYVFVGAGKSCLRLRADTGERQAPYPLPSHYKDKLNYQWGYLAVDGELLLGSGVRRGSFYSNGRGPWYDQETAKVNSDFLFAIGQQDRKLRWKYDGVIINSTITVGGGRVYFLEQRDPGLLAAKSRLLSEAGTRNMVIVALDEKTGGMLWEIAPGDHGGAAQMFFVCYKDEVLSVTRSTRGVYKIWAYGAADGKQLWSKNHRATHTHHGGHRRKTLIVGQTLLQEPVAYDLRTGKQKWTVAMRHKCGSLSASANYLFGRYRAQNHHIFDIGVLDGSRKGTTIERLTSVTRPGCWINMIAAGGLVLAPEASSGCSCGFPIRATMAFAAE